jgi:hypothetical protein
LISSAKLSFPGYFYDNLAELIFGDGGTHASSAVGTQMISECGAGGTRGGRFRALQPSYASKSNHPIARSPH